MRRAARVGAGVHLAKKPSFIDSWESQVQKDPFKVSSDEKYDVPRDATGRMREEGVVARTGNISFTTVEKYYASSEGSRIHQRITSSSR